MRGCRHYLRADTAGFFTTGPVHGSQVVTNLGGRSGAEVWGLASAEFYLGSSQKRNK